MNAIATSKAGCILRGLRLRCPQCGRGRLLARYLKPVAACAHCGEAFGHMRADDFPPYLTIMIVGHIVVPLVLLCHQRGMSPELQAAIFVPMTLLMTVLALPRCKGAIIGLMWSLGMTGNEAR